MARKKIDPAEEEKKAAEEHSETAAGAAAESSGEKPEGRSRKRRSKTRELEEKVAALEREKGELMEKYLRLAAEFENFKKLMAKEIENRIRSANEELIVDLLPVLDNLERTLASVPDSEEVRPFAQGVELIYREMKKVLGKYGLEEIESVGKEFDVDLHEALTLVEDKNYPSNVVVQEHQKGYKLNGRVIRHAKVAVNK